MYVKKEGLTIFTAFSSLPSVHNATKPKFFWVVTDTSRLKSTFSFFFHRTSKKTFQNNFDVMGIIWFSNA